MEKQVYFMALKAEGVVLFVVVIKKIRGIRTCQQVFEERAMNRMA